MPGLGKIERRFKKGFSILAGFTWSKLFEDTSFLRTADRRLSRGAQTGRRRPAVPSDRLADLGHSGGPQAALRRDHAEVGGCRGRRLGTVRQLQYSVGRAGGVQHASFFCGKDFALPRSQQSLNQWFDTTCFYPFPNANTTIATLAVLSGLDRRTEPAGLQLSYRTAGDTIKNGVYQDFANYVQTSPTRWGDRARQPREQRGCRPAQELPDSGTRQAATSLRCVQRVQSSALRRPRHESRQFHFRPRDTVAAEPGAQPWNSARGCRSSSSSVANSFESHARADHKRVSHRCRHGYLEPLTEQVLSAVFEVSNTLRGGFLEKVYERALLRELTLRGIPGPPKPL